MIMSRSLSGRACSAVMLTVTTVSPNMALEQKNELLAPFLQMVDAEWAFAARARVVGWKQAFLEYFADDAVGFDGTQSGPAKDQIRKQPDPPKDVQLLWEPDTGTSRRAATSAI